MNISILDRVKTFGEKHQAAFPVVLLLAALISYGTFGFFCGFYWDDWPPVMLSNISKANVFWNAYVDRPFSSWTYSVMFPILKNSALAWQLTNILLRVAGAYLLYLTLEALFPRQKELFQWAALLSIVLPIFRFQYIAVAFSQHFLTYAIFAASLYFLVLSIKTPKRFWIFFPLSLLFTAAHVFMMEYFVGLEILRPVIIYIALKNAGVERTKRLRKTVFLAFPFVVILLGYLSWRIFIFPALQGINSTYSNSPFILSGLLSNTMQTLIQLFQMIVEDFRYIFVSSWVERIWPADLLFESKVLWLSLLLGMVVAGLFLLFFGQKKEGKLWISTREFLDNFCLGLMLFFFGILPVWTSLRQVAVGKYSERFALAALPGIALIIVTFVWKIANSGRTRNILLSIIVVASVSFQVQTGNFYRKDYAKQQSFYSQLKWRIPALKSGTTIYSPNIISDQEADYSYSMGINLLYDNNIQDSLNYWFWTPRYQSVATLLYDKNLLIDGVIRGPKFSGTSSEMVAVYMPDSGCLLVLDPIYAQFPSGVEEFTSYGDLTNFDQIIDTGADSIPFPQAFGKISTNQWCYYFEQADLARQEKDWVKVINLYDQASAQGFEPTESIEYIPLIQALAETGQISNAFTLTENAISMSKQITPSACKLWSDLTQVNPEIASNLIAEFLKGESCTTGQP